MPKEPPIDTAVVMQVIRTTLLIRGIGTPESPMRFITQYWSLDGELLAEVDPCRPKAPDWGDQLKPLFQAND